MPLQTKFALLLGLLVLTTSLILTASLAFGDFLERELVDPFVRTTEILRGLDELQRLNAELASQLGQTPAADERLAAEARARLEQQQATDAWRAGIGPSTVRSLASLFDAADAHTRRWTDAADPRDRDLAARARAQARELIDAIERRVINDAPRALAYGSELRAIHRTLITSGFAAAALFVLLCVLIFRRWVIRPVRDLRQAALTIGAGDFTHRVPVASRDELGMLSHEVNHMASLIAAMQADAVDRERLAATGAMVRRLAHNIRNPLAAIRSLAELTRRRAPNDDAIQGDQAEIITAVDRFNTWLTDLLSVTTPRGIAPRPEHVKPWLTDLVDAHRPLARMRDVELTLDLDDAPDSAAFDRRHLEHAVVSILTNAIQASPSAARVVVSASADTRFWTISVADRGSGIHPDNLERIFTPYFTTKRDGTGIGLAISRQVVKGHGGEIHVDSAAGEGSVFTIRLPIGSIQPTEPAEINRSAESSRQEEEHARDPHR